jgi:hypothetical protein
MRKITTGLVAVAALMTAGIASTQAKAAPPVLELKQQSLVEEARSRVRTVRRPYVRRPYARRPIVRRPVIRTLRGVGRAARSVGNAARSVGRTARRLSRIF